MLEGAATLIAGPPAFGSFWKKLIASKPSQARMPTAATTSTVTPSASLRRRAASLTGFLVVQMVPSSSGLTPASACALISWVRSSASAASSSARRMAALVRIPPWPPSSIVRTASDDSSCGT